MRVTFAETMVGRSTSKTLSYMQLLNQALNIYSPNPMKNIRNLLEYEAQLIFWQNLLSFGFGKIYRSIHSKEHRPWEDLRSILNVTMRASNLWREEKFPDRYQMEIQNSHYVRNRLLANFIPVGEVFHSLMAAAAIAYGPTAQSLVRLENKSDLHS